MFSPDFASSPATVGLLLSGGLDSSILLGCLLSEGEWVQPFYVRSGLTWERPEFEAVNRLVASFDSPLLESLVVLDLPLGDLYGRHWSLTGRDVPGATTPDEAVFLPGRNALLIIKTGLWCQLRGIDRLALGVLESNPFGDATSDFFSPFEAAMNCCLERPLRIIRPLAGCDKREVMHRGRQLPLQLTFSCIDPVEDLHCGRCNKCAERQAAFRLIDLPDPTDYRYQPASIPNES